MNHQMAFCALQKVPATVESASVHHMTGMFQGNSVNVMTGTATNMMALFAQAMGYVTVETVNAGKDGMETPVKYGSEMNTPKSEIWKLFFYFNIGCYRHTQ